ncbi:glycosyltransferase BC10-like isoform X1 [Prosopis cineraria]|uniref:glycosyltransferase BC10-like isoform X1 n=1 Tax=Prosopis cineraria TaxID=364024 RepID=UPI00240F9A68|nr:glycosyltransferase BC10-like isoform X1 [Prosopis cineraria]XP_054788488.1 glycosyltransferase BC10-like isoform X1 [Prosopis cineraria]XP_054788489.1 glycosyltransferase BC10-like isoform X1 [Prosopis cineraria]XP_054788490.1 glycosyltransferase BC10-like isoform X1 [Prosopis cineraria]
MVGARNRLLLRRHSRTIVTICLVIIFLVAAYIYLSNDTPPNAFPQITDYEIESRVVNEEILKISPIETKNPKVAFLFMTPGPLPFEKLWHTFFEGHEGKFSVYVHTSKEKPIHKSRYFVGREIHSKPVGWGTISTVEAERRLLANALSDPDNQHFVLLSDSCIPVRSFDFVYNYFLLANVSFIECFVDPGPHGNGRYIEHMLPEVEMKNFRKGSQWFSMKRQHAIMILADNLYLTKFKFHCRPKMNGRNCYASEHYLPTFFNMFDPSGIANWSVTYVDWSEGKWHPRLFKVQDVTSKLLNAISSMDESVHYTSDSKRSVMITPCVWNGSKRPCYLFARIFYPRTLDRLMHLFSNFTTF